MIDLFRPVSTAVTDTLNVNFEERQRRSNVVDSLMLWLIGKAKKKNVPDLSERLEEMRKRTKKMVEDMEIAFDKSKLVIKVAGSSERTWQMYRLGTDWFEPDEKAVEHVLAGLLDDSARYTNNANEQPSA